MLRNKYSKPREILAGNGRQLTALTHFPPEEWGCDGGYENPGVENLGSLEGESKIHSPVRFTTRTAAEPPQYG